MNRLRPVHLLAIGFVVFVLGFLYDGMFAGIPYQDPTAEMQANWLYHNKIASRVMLGGIVIFVTGFLWTMVNLAKRLLIKRG